MPTSDGPKCCHFCYELARLGSRTRKSSDAYEWRTEVLPLRLPGGFERANRSCDFAIKTIKTCGRVIQVHARAIFRGPSSGDKKMSEPNRHAQLVTWLEDQGHTPDDIERILAKLQAYDKQTAHESIFDSISAGHFDLQKIIDEALSREGGAGSREN